MEGKGKEYNDDDELIFKGEYVNGKRKGKFYDSDDVDDDYNFI